MRPLAALSLMGLVLLGCTPTNPGDPCDAGSDCTPTAICTAPALADIGTPTSVVGDGTAASCTAAALATAASGGGTITFNCGSAPITIEVASPIVFTQTTVLDGEGRITLSGGKRTRILYLDSGYDQTTPRLTVQRLTFRDGLSPAGGEDTAQGGGAIYRDGGSLTVIDCTFIENRGPATGQDVAGGAIYGFGGGDIVVSGSSFVGNSASNGGAIGSLNGDLTVINSTFVGNAATGTGGNPGNGGCGGAIYQDGADEVSSACGVSLRDNTAGAIGGGWFRVSNYNNGTFTMERSTVDANRVTPTGSGNAGGMYLQGLVLRITASTISRNQAFYNGGIWLHTSDVDLTNVTIAENTAFGSNGGGIWLSDLRSGTLKNVTLANNRSTAQDQIAGAIFGAGLTLHNTLISGNSAMWVGECNEEHGGGSNNLQWPGDSLCSASPLIADPALGALGENGGPTETLVPSPTSPARALGTDCPETDQRGQPRGNPCTVGATEVP
ncbi:MAG: right-handed parallel beta-helix repeat-containing protein [Myxococcota bacterium]|nr:right-handed parallel beta-helix repeat-containing protein [Myxococcota bacterium]